MQKFSEPKTLTRTIDIHAFDVSIMGITLNQSAILNIGFYDVDGMTVGRGALTMMGDDYKGWKDDDDYVIQYVIANFEKIIMM